MIYADSATIFFVCAIISFIVIVVDVCVAHLDIKAQQSIIINWGIA